MPSDVKAKANTELASGVPFLSDQDLRAALDKAGVPKATTDEIVKENADARIDALRSSLSVIALIALIALFTSITIPTQHPKGATPEDQREDQRTPQTSVGEIAPAAQSDL